jgi:hypothetical protein
MHADSSIVEQMAITAAKRTSSLLSIVLSLEFGLFESCHLAKELCFIKR